MQIYLNEKEVELLDGISLHKIKDQFKVDADLVILNGFPKATDDIVSEGDRVVLIKKGELPKQVELEALMASRHTPGVHQKMKAAKVVVAGLGGLGSNIAIALARIGVGHLVLADFDVVEPSNLNRQAYFVSHIGMAKTEAMKDLISSINPFVEVTLIKDLINAQNIEDYFKDADAIIEAFDKPEYKAELVNTVLTKMPEKKIVAASGMAGYGSNNSIVTKRVLKNFYLVGDEVSEAKVGNGLMAPRVGIAASHQANMAVRLLLGETDV